VQTVRVRNDGGIEFTGPVERTAMAALSAETLRMVSVATDVVPRASTARWLSDWPAFGPVPLDTWEPSYGRLAEAQVKWEASHGRALSVD